MTHSVYLCQSGFICGFPFQGPPILGEGGFVTAHVTACNGLCNGLSA